MKKSSVQQGFSLISCCKMLFRSEKWRTFMKKVNFKIVWWVILMEDPPRVLSSISIKGKKWLQFLYHNSSLIEYVWANLFCSLLKDVWIFLNRRLDFANLLARWIYLCTNSQIFNIQIPENFFSKMLNAWIFGNFVHSDDKFGSFVGSD